MANTSEIAELDALLRAGILTADEHAQAQRKLAARSNGGNGQGPAAPVHVLRPTGAPPTRPHPATGGRPGGPTSTVQGGAPPVDQRLGHVQAAPARVAPPSPRAQAAAARRPVRSVSHAAGHSDAATGAAPDAATGAIATLPRVDEADAPRSRIQAGRGRHAKDEPPQWPWVLIGLFALVSVTILSVALIQQSRHHKAHPSGPARAASHSADQGSPPPVVVGSKVDTPVSINVNGADATVTVSKLKQLPAATNAKAVPYQATVTALGVYGSFPIDSTNFSAESNSGATVHAQVGKATPLTKTVVTTGRRVAGTIVFSVPKGQSVQTVLFTTSLGEQLGIWTTY
jgi:hypothetical protein